MANFPTPSQLQQQYFQILKSLKPSLNVNDQNSDFVIRGKAFTGIMSGMYGDQKKVNNDTFILSMRPEALISKGADLAIPQQPATQAKCPELQVPVPTGQTVNPGDLTFIYVPTGILYTNTTGGTGDGSGLLVVIAQCQVAGQVGNIAYPDTLKIVSPPAGVGQTATLLVNMADGSDVESTDSYRARLLAREQQPPAGGNSFDYPEFAFEADPSVRSAFIRRFGRGLGTVDIYITTGTTDIDTAVTQGQSIVRIPSMLVLANVQTYYDDHAPLCDCPVVYAPTEVNVDATVDVVLAAGLTMTSVPSDPINNPLNLNCRQLIQREIGRAMYKLPAGGRKIPGYTNGFVPASDLEEGLDVWLSAVKDPVSGLFIGKIPILADREMQPLDPPNYNKALAANQLAKPGTITVTSPV